MYAETRSSESLLGESTLEFQYLNRLSI